MKRYYIEIDERRWMDDYDGAREYLRYMLRMNGWTPKYPLHRERRWDSLKEVFFWDVPDNQWDIEEVPVHPHVDPQWVLENDPPPPDFISEQEFKV